MENGEQKQEKIPRVEVRFYIDADLLEWVKAECERTGRSRSWWLNDAVYRRAMALSSSRKRAKRS